jgi:hypothetical protein
MKCHISSNSISLIEFDITGSAVASAIFFIHLYGVLRDTPNNFPKNPYDDLPIEYNIILNAFFISVAWFVRLSPTIKL